MAEVVISTYMVSTYMVGPRMGRLRLRLFKTCTAKAHDYRPVNSLLAMSDVVVFYTED